MRAIKTRIYPNNKQKELLNSNFGCVRYIYNRCLNIKINRHKEFKENINIYELSKMVTFWKTTDELGFLKDANAQSLQQCLRHLDSSYKMFFKGSGFPKFKKKSNNQSYSVVGYVSIVDNKIKFPKIGLINCRGLRKFRGKIKTATVSKNCADQYFISFVIDDVINEHKPKVIKEAVGIDLGIKDFATTNTGTKYPNHKFIKEAENKIKYYQRRMSKCVKGSSNFKKLKYKIAVLWNKINNKKNDFLHKLSTDMAKNHDLISIEDLNVKGMLKDKRYSKSISEMSWYEFIRQLKYKCDWYGTHLEMVDPKYTSQDCSTVSCNFRNKKLKLSDRSWKCPTCNTVHDRDINASKNILIKGMDSILKSGRDISIGLIGETRTQLV